MKPKSTLHPFLLLAVGTTALLTTFSAHADTLYWDVDGTTAGFSTVVGGWDGTNAFWNTDSTGSNLGTVQAGTTSGDDLIISQATTNGGNITVSGARLASSITFAPNVGPTSIITGGSITIGGSGASSGIFQQSSGANTINTSLTLNSANSAFSFSSTAAGTLNIASAVTGTATTGNTQTINVGSSSGNVTLTGAISDGANGGKVAVVYGGGASGNTTLSASSTYSGGFTLNSGRVNGIGTGIYGGFGSGTVTINGGTLLVNSGANATIQNNMNWKANFSVDRSPSGTPTVNWDGNITLGANVTVHGPAAGSNYYHIFNGNILDDITGGRALSFTTQGTGGRQFVTLNGNNTFTGNLSISRGSLTIGGTGKLGGGDYSGNIIVSTAYAPITYSSSSDQILRGAISGTGLALAKTTNNSVLTLFGTNTYNGATTISAGILRLGTSGSIANSTSMAIAAGATLDTSGKSSYVLTASQPVEFGVDAAGSGSAGKITAAELSITNAAVTYNISGPLDDAVYVLATYSNLLGGTFASAPTPPSGYELQYDYAGGTQIALVSTGAPTGFAAWQDANSTTGTLADDHDNDGVDNGTEFFLGGTAGTTGFTALPGVDNTGGTLSVTWTKAATYPVTAVYGTDFAVETSDTLTGWSTAATNGAPNVPDTVYINGNNVTYTFPAGTKKFARLKVTGP